MWLLFVFSSIEFRVSVNVCIELWSVNVIVRGRFWFNSNTDRFACILMFTDIRHSHHQEKSRSLLNIEIDFYKCAGWIQKANKWMNEWECECHLVGLQQRFVVICLMLVCMLQANEMTFPIDWIQKSISLMKWYILIN